MWDCDVNGWNAENVRPQRDLYGDLLKALRKKDLKTIATFHHARTLNWYVPKEVTEKEKGAGIFSTLSTLSIAGMKQRHLRETSSRSGKQM